MTEYPHEPAARDPFGHGALERCDKIGAIMPIAAGQLLGPYTVLSKLGAGGMGVVWRATDTRLDRPVALKVLPDALAHDPERLARFHREARLLASLSHPGIATLFGFEEIEGQAVLIMELVEGETLADRLTRGPMPMDEVLTVARSIAEALEEAHERGIVHRDLKPANVKVARDGRVKVLDFGLAKALSVEASEPASGLSASPTLTRTSEGVVLGTAAYMAPEQARGTPVDKRADIFAFGALLFEMLSGRKPFTGDSTSDVLAAVLRADPDWSVLPAETPATLRTLLGRCLEKARSLRLRDIGEARIALAAPQTAAAESRGDGTKVRPRRSSAVRAGLAVALGGTILAWMGPRWAAGTRSPAAMRFSAVTNSPGVDAEPSLSSDGRSLAFVSNRDGQFDVWVRLIAGGRLLQITNDRNLDADPRFSADGSQIAFSKLSDTGRWGIWVVSALGGEPRLVIPDAKDPAWSPDGNSLAYSDLRTATIWMADASGAHARAITQHEPGLRHYTQRRPAFSHDGRHVAFERRTGGPFVDLGVVELDTGRQRALTNETRLAASPAWSRDDRWVYYASSRGGTVNIWKIGLQGGPPQQVTVGQGDDTEPSLSPDGKRMAFATHRAKYGIGELVLDSPGSDPPVRWLTSDTADGAQAPAYSPDGERIAYFSIRSGGESDSTVWVMGRDGRNALPLLRDAHRNIFPRWSRDGKSVVFSSWTDETETGARRVHLAGGPPEVITSELLFPADTDPMGRLLGWAPDQHPRIYDPAARKTVTVEAVTGIFFRWSPDGSRIAFIQPPGSEAPGLWVYDFTNAPRRAFEGWVAGIAWPRADTLVVAEGHSDLRASLWRLEIEAGKREPLRATVPLGYNFWDEDLLAYFDVSPDRRRLAITALEQWEADIGLIEDFP